jgi:hypothetical protein
MSPRNSKRNRRLPRRGPNAGWGGKQMAVVNAVANEISDDKLSDPETRRGIYFDIKPSNVVVPTRNGVKPADVQFLSFLFTVATGAQLSTSGFITAYFTTDDDHMPNSAKWDVLAINAILDFKEFANCGYHRTIAGAKGEVRTRFAISAAHRREIFDCDDANKVMGRLYFFFPAGITPTTRLYAECLFEGVESSSVAPSPPPEPAYDRVYSTVSLDFLRLAFAKLARTVFFNAHVEGENIVAKPGLFVLYSEEGNTSEELTRPMMDLLTEEDLPTYRPPLTGIVFPRRDPTTNLLHSALSQWCRQKISLPSTPGQPAEYWWAHVQEESFTVVCGAQLDLVDCYERLPTLTPRTRTAAEILTSAVAGAASFSVSANDREQPAEPNFTPVEIARLRRLMASGSYGDHDDLGFVPLNLCENGATDSD